MSTDDKDKFFTEWEETFDSFDQMGLHENLLRGIYAYGESQTLQRSSQEPSRDVGSDCALWLPISSWQSAVTPLLLLLWQPVQLLQFGSSRLVACTLAPCMRLHGSVWLPLHHHQTISSGNTQAVAKAFADACTAACSAPCQVLRSPLLSSRRVSCHSPRVWT